MLNAIKIVRAMKAENQNLFMKESTNINRTKDTLSKLNIEMELLEKVIDNLEIERKK